MKRPPRPGETIWVRQAYVHHHHCLNYNLRAEVVVAHKGMWIQLSDFVPGYVSPRYVHRFDEGVTWWRLGVDLRAQQVADALR